MKSIKAKARLVLTRGSLGIILSIVVAVFLSCKSTDDPVERSLQPSRESTVHIVDIHPNTTPIESREDASSATASLASQAETTPTTVAETLVPSVSPAVKQTTEVTQAPQPISALELAGGEDYMLLTSNNLLWHPDMTTTISQPFNKMSFSRAPWSPDGRQLAMRLLTHDGLAIFSIVDGSIMFLHETPPNSDAPLWSPDGRYLLFKTETIDSQVLPKIVIYDLETGGVALETQPIELINLVGWSSDSSKVALLRWGNINDVTGRVPLLEVRDLASGIAQVYQNPGGDLWINASWSPRDDKLVLFGIDPDMGIPEPGFLVYAYHSINLIDLNTGHIDPLLGAGTHKKNANNDELPSLFLNTMPWSPDGESIIYSELGKVCHLELSLNSETCPDELNHAITTTGSIGGDYPSWSPTGDWIGFILSFPDTYGGPIAVIRPDGSDLRNTDKDSGEVSLFGPVWSPNQ